MVGRPFVPGDKRLHRHTKGEAMPPIKNKENRITAVSLLEPPPVPVPFPKSAKNAKGQFVRGNPGKAKGSIMRSHREAKEAIAECFERIGGVRNFAQWAQKNQTEFYRIYAKLLPIHLQGSATGGAISIVVSADEDKL